ncbi:hypothetical protein K438DRAFT_1954546 [Mycena galopus ATCC 62051]|nr:hypothetical protein K438DRAFT_1954546 [Mycena galopus ATCC 62051]
MSVLPSPRKEGGGSLGEVPCSPSLTETRRKSQPLSMDELVLEYNEHRDAELSLYHRATSIASKKSLDISDIWDQGVSIRAQPLPLARFGLDPGLFLKTEHTLLQMQKLLERAATLVLEWKSCFLVDPHRVLMTNLRSTSSLSEMQAAWAALSERMDLAKRNFEKYQSKYNAESSTEVLLSPVSTLSGIYSIFPQNAKPALDLDYLYSHVPHLKKHWPKGYSPHTNMVGDKMDVPSHLARAFPERVAEARPSTVFYSMDGEQQEFSVSGRSSYRSDADFAVPPENPGARD